jgi:hypothetical protein
MKSPVALLASLLHDVKRLVPGVKGLDRDLNTIELRFKHEGYGFLSIALPQLCGSLDRGLADMKYTCPLGFSKKGTLPKLLSGLFCAVFDSKTGQLLNEPCIHSVKCIREICMVFKKLLYSDDREDFLHAKAVKEFADCDNLLVGSIDSTSMDYYLSAVSKYVLMGLNSYDPRVLKPKHGPGSVAEGYTPNQKWSGVLSDMVKYDRYSTWFGFDSTVFRSFDDQGTYSKYLTEDVDAQCNAPTGIAKLISVPKSSSARRTISMEPVYKQFIQQGLNTVLRDAISRCTVLQGCLALTDQSANQMACLEGSRTSKIATIDLSSASDRLSLQLVKKIFASKGPFLEDLVSSRSSFITVDSTCYELKKYAGMGNATTFPVQSVAFALLAICSILSSGGIRPTFGNVVRASRLLRVFGDDITIPTEYVVSLDNWLTFYGLKINHKKSFSTGFFRESCGVDAFHGKDVTPVYVKSWPTLLMGKQDLVPHLVSVSNSFWMRGLYEASDCVRQAVEDLVGPLPLVSTRSSGLGWHSRVDTNIAQKWDGKLQRFVFRTLEVRGTRIPDPLDGYAALLKSLLSLESKCSNSHLDYVEGPTNREKIKFDTLIISDSKNLSSSPKRFRNRLRWRWLPTRVG